MSEPPAAPVRPPAAPELPPWLPAAWHQHPGLVQGHMSNPRPAALNVLPPVAGTSNPAPDPATRRAGDFIPQATVLGQRNHQRLQDPAQVIVPVGGYRARVMQQQAQGFQRPELAQHQRAGVVAGVGTAGTRPPPQPLMSQPAPANLEAFRMMMSQQALHRQQQSYARPPAGPVQQATASDESFGQQRVVTHVRHQPGEQLTARYH
jgi:hypothetical protein